MKKTIDILRKPFTQTMSVPGSKSITNRALLLAAMARGESRLNNLLRSDDTEVFARALIKLGIPISWDKKERVCYIRGQKGDFPNHQTDVYCQDAGTAARFLMAAVAQSKGHYFLHGSERLEQRPLAELIDCLRTQGIETEPASATKMPLAMMSKGQLPGGDIALSGQQSSQFISALLMVAPLAKKTVRLNVDHYISQPYVKMTVEMMRQFGIEIHTRDFHQFEIPGQQQYQAQNYTIEPDLSTASYFFAAAALCQSTITMKQINRLHCLQGDIAFLDVLEKMGCNVLHNEKKVTVTGPKTLQGIDVDMADCSDTFMTLACIAPFAAGPTRIRNIAHTRLQECDRIAAVAKNLKALGINTDVTHDSITIYPGQIKPATLDSFNDHRIAMAFSLIGLRIPGMTITGAEAVGKTCPDYFELLASLHHEERVTVMF